MKARDTEVIGDDGRQVFRVVPSNATWKEAREAARAIAEHDALLAEVTRLRASRDKWRELAERAEEFAERVSWVVGEEDSDQAMDIVTDIRLAAREEA